MVELKNEEPLDSVIGKADLNINKIILEKDFFYTTTLEIISGQLLEMNNQNQKKKQPKAGSS